MIKLVAFDWNGTLLADTRANIMVANVMTKTFGLKRMSLLQYQKTFDIPIINYWVANGFDRKTFIKNAEAIQAIYYANYEPLADKCRTRSGTKEVLRMLKNKKIGAVIYSNHTRKKIQRQLKRLKLDGHLFHVLAREEEDNSHHHVRSKEIKLCQYVKDHKLQPKEVITVGDTIEEIEIGKKHGFVTVAITGGYNTVARLKKRQPDFLIHNMKELVGIINKLNRK